MLRRLIAVVLSLLVAISLFWLMQSLISSGKDQVKKADDFSGVDFVRLKKDETLETRSRKKPPKPPPPKKPPPPPDLSVKQQQPDRSPTPFKMPDLNVPTNIQGGPFLGGFAPGAGGNELIPLVRVAPRYPRRALRDGISGRVVLEVVVNPDGTVREARVIEASPRGVFESAAISAVYKWKFKPKVVDGKPVEHTGIQPLDFNMEN